MANEINNIAQNVINDVTSSLHNPPNIIDDGADRKDVSTFTETLGSHAKGLLTVGQIDAFAQNHEIDGIAKRAAATEALEVGNCTEMATVGMVKAAKSLQEMGKNEIEDVSLSLVSSKGGEGPGNGAHVWFEINKDNEKLAVDSWSSEKEPVPVEQLKDSYKGNNVEVLQTIKSEQFGDFIKEYDKAQKTLAEGGKATIEEKVKKGLEDENGLTTKSVLAGIKQHTWKQSETTSRNPDLATNSSEQGKPASKGRLEVPKEVNDNMVQNGEEIQKEEIEKEKARAEKEKAMAEKRARWAKKDNAQTSERPANPFAAASKIGARARPVNPFLAAKQAEVDKKTANPLADIIKGREKKLGPINDAIKESPEASKEVSAIKSVKELKASETNAPAKNTIQENTTKQR